ncbi:MAG: antibiotic biosynthesis monooxygenase [Gammaproteobacteria bacterium]|nr:antibiotic biosynthesis monooxygenase [Gammaproteobacteria bacterium]
MTVDNNTGIPCDSPVTIIVKRRPKPGMEKEFEEVMTGTTRDAMKFPGHLGVNIIRPTSPGDYYRIVFKFDSMRNYIAWESSAVREEWLRRYAEVTLGDDEQEILSGLETWFTLPGGQAVVPPPKHKMAIIIWISIFPLSIAVNYALRPLLDGLHIIWQIGIISLVLVLLMTYAVMPVMSKLFHRWLHCNK